MALTPSLSGFCYRRLMESVFDDLIGAVKVPRKRRRLAFAIVTFAVLTIVAGAGFAWKSSDRAEPKLPTIDIGQILHPGVV
ncbi:hypothetical protein C1D09_003865 [Mesorhizobium intechi]|uniref:Uncharacterized protein n=1 Tax=Mesorhizobium intechi TaxID=537601 RepID=A0A8T9AVH6_9HYPH|nr:hypothetical protein [Mesorhizobium intechi]TSE13459.1 hypothetical protein C1D09_003865 [Mesorhizobium intechi]